ncbi:hypothetical protein BKA62DRAFT_705384, partial [Auriculariales sp. MPI-PUGE-AT-0066]
MRLHRYPMPVPTRMSIFPLLMPTATAQSLRELLEQIGLVNSPLLDYPKKIDECFVTQVGQYRCQKSNSAHELVVLTMEFMDLRTGDVFKRHFRLEGAWKGGKLFSMSRQSVLDQVQTSDELIDDTHGIMKSEYELVREFAVSRGTLPVIDALVLGDTLSELSERYTIRAVVAYKEGKNAVVNDGPGLRLAGTFRGMRLVDINTGRAIFSNEKQSDLRDFVKWKACEPPSPQAEEVAKSLAQAPIGGSITSAAAEQVAEGQIGSDLTTNMVYQIAKRSAAELRHKVRSKCVENYERNFYEPPRHNPPPNPAGLSSPKWAPH